MTVKKFDFIIGNPPFNGPTTDTTLYPKFMETCYKLGKVVELITPGRFIFGAGKTKGITEKIMEDPHIRLIKYFANSKDAFPRDVEIKGGVAITLRDDKNLIGPIGKNSNPVEIKSLILKFSNIENLQSRSYGCSSYSWSKKFKEDLNDPTYKQSNLHSDCFKKLEGRQIFLKDEDSLKPQASSLKPSLLPCSRKGRRRPRLEVCKKRLRKSE